MRVIVLGGTRFIGRAIAEALTAAGHAVLVAHRGVSEPAGLRAVEHLHAERGAWPGHGAAFAAFGADAAVDVSAGNGPDARAALAALPPGIPLVALSSVDVYRAYQALHSGTQTDPVPLTEESPLRTARHIDGPRWENLDVEEAYLAAGATILRLDEPGEDQVMGGPGFEPLVQVGLHERVGKTLDDDRLAVPRRHPSHDRADLRADVVRGSLSPVVLDVNDRYARTDAPAAR